MEQKYSSKNTSLNQIPKAIKIEEFQSDDVILDWGCGGYDKTKTYIESFGATYFGYDPYWKSDEENKKALNCCPTKIFCCNVLNVIMEDEIIEDILWHLSVFRIGVVIQVYEGDKTGVGKPTTKGYQRNWKSDQYLPLLKLYFQNVKKKGNIFYCD